MSESNLELCYISATEAIKKFKEKTLSPVELVSLLFAIVNTLLVGAVLPNCRVLDAAASLVFNSK